MLLSHCFVGACALMNTLNFQYSPPIPVKNQPVIVQGVVTRIDSKGFFLQTPYPDTRTDTFEQLHVNYPKELQYVKGVYVGDEVLWIN